MAQRRKGGSDDEVARNASLFQFGPEGDKAEVPSTKGGELSGAAVRPPGDDGKAPVGPKIYEVSELTKLIKKKLETDPAFHDVWVKGEVSNFSQSGKGHMYFSLKDANAVIKCMIWREVASKVKFQLADGLKLLVRGEITVYPQGGQYNLSILEVRPEGIGALYLAFEQLKKKLQSEGLFDDGLKRKLPFLPSIVGVVTSPTGAVIQDIRNVLYRRFPNAHLVLAPVRVQGDGAAQEIIAAIRLMNSLEHDRPDVIIIARGGGSLEDLWAFNDEQLARAIRASAIPIISAVGHETDFTIADFVSDLRAPTPSAAAELVMPDRAELERRILDRMLSLRKELASRFNQSRQHTDDLLRRLEHGIVNILNAKKEKLLRLTHVLDAMSPMQVLGRGYSITISQATGTAVRDPGELSEGEGLRTLLSRGEVLSSVISIKTRGDAPCRPKTQKKK